MKLLNRTEAQSSIKKQNEELIESNIRLRTFWKDITGKLQRVKDDYEPEKMAKLKEFEQFCKDLLVKKSKLLGEMTTLQKEIDIKKEIYYGMIAKQDALDEKVYEMKEMEKKLQLRETFVLDLEERWRTKNER